MLLAHAVASAARSTPMHSDLHITH